MRLLTTWLSLISIFLTGLVSCRPVRVGLIPAMNNDSSAYMLPTPATTV